MRTKPAKSTNGKFDTKIDALARAVKSGFDEVDKRFDETGRKLDAFRSEVNKRFDRVEFLVSGQERRIEILEDRMRQVAVKIGLRFN